MRSITSHIRKEFREHAIDYLLLLTVGVFFLLFLKTFKGNRVASFATIVLFVISYIVWSVFHHIKDESLHLKNVIEYILIAAVVLFLLGLVYLA